MIAQRLDLPGDFWRACSTNGYGQPITNPLVDSGSREGASIFVNNAGQIAGIDFPAEGIVKEGEMSLQWTRALSVGIGEIDDQHKELFGRINKMLDIIVESSAIDEIGKVIDFLDDYVISHFATEVGLMKRFDYPDLEYHLQQHEEFTRQFHPFRDRCRQEGPSKFLAIQIEEMMVEWWTNHINKVDKLLGSFLKERL